MLFLYHFNWAGTPEELREYVVQMKSIIKGTEDVKFMGLFIPTTEWHYALVMDTPSYEKALQVMKSYVKKFGWEKRLWRKLNYFIHLRSWA